MDPCFEWWCYMGYLGCFAWSGWIRGRILFKGGRVSYPKKMLTKSWFLVRRWGKELWVVGCKVRSHLKRRFFLPQNPRWPPLFFFPMSWPPPPPFSPLAWPPLPFPLWLATPLLPLQQPSIASSSLDLPLRSKDQEEEEHVELKRKRGPRRCSTPSLLADFLGETLGGYTPDHA
jgi:hypothetical protein